jgi:hypothetical protein
MVTPQLVGPIVFFCVSPTAATGVSRCQRLACSMSLSIRFDYSVNLILRTPVGEGWSPNLSYSVRPFSRWILCTVETSGWFHCSFATSPTSQCLAFMKRSSFASFAPASRSRSRDAPPSPNLIPDFVELGDLRLRLLASEQL